MAIRLSIRIPGRSRAVHLWEGDAPRIRVGRSSQADLRLPDSRISSLHLELCFDREAGTYRARDLDSMNGTRLNGRGLGISGMLLAPGDQLSLGRIRLSVEAISAAGTPAGLGPPPADPAETTTRIQQVLDAFPSRLPVARMLRAGPGWNLREALLDAAVLLIGLAAALLLLWVATIH